MLLKSGFSGLLTSNGIGTTEIGPPPHPPNAPQGHQQQSSVIGASVSTFKSHPHPPPSPNLSNGSPMRNNNQQQQFDSQLQQVTSSPLSSFKLNHFQKNGSTSLFAIANRNANGAGSGTLAVNHNNSSHAVYNGPPSHSSTDSSSDCGVNLMNPELGRLKSMLQPQQMPSPQKSLNHHNSQPQVGHQQQPYPHNNNGLDIDQQQHSMATGMAVKEDLPPIDCFSMTNHQRHDEIQLLNQIQDTLKEGWTVHLAENGRLYYCK